MKKEYRTEKKKKEKVKVEGVETRVEGKPRWEEEGKKKRKGKRANEERKEYRKGRKRREWRS